MNRLECFPRPAVRHATLLFAAEALGVERWYRVRQSLPADPEAEESIRSMPIRQPVLWMNRVTHDTR